MNFALQREIYGLTPWMVDVHSMPTFTAMLRNFQSGVGIEIPTTRYNTPTLYNLKSDCIEECDYDTDEPMDYDGIAVINLNGPIVKNGGLSSVGMQELSIMMLDMAKDDNIKGFLMLTDSGGGSSAAVEIMNDTIIEIKQTKPVYALVSKGGMACSAAYGIISGCHKIFSDGEMNTVGSIGTMIQFCGKEANTDDKDGFKYVRVYATKSTMKNKGYEEALKGNYEFIINEMLDPFNEVFINMILGNRPAVANVTFDDGSTFLSKDAIGSLIDGISSFSEVIDAIIADPLYNKSVNFNSSLINNSSKMTKEEIRNAHPVAHAEIVAEGVNAERERVNSWLVYQQADPEAVAAGIESGKDITQSQTHKFLVKMNSAEALSALKVDGAKPIVTDQSGTQEAAAATELEAHYATVDARLGLTSKK